MGTIRRALQNTKLKKMILLIGLLWALLLSCGHAYQGYLGGNPNFVLCDGHMGTAWYVDRSSLVVGKYAPPQYILAVNVVTVHNADRGNTAIDGVRTMRYFYNSDLGQMYIDRNGNDDWRYLNPRGSWAETGVSMPAGEIAFALAYRMKFYGIYSDSFYDRI